MLACMCHRPNGGAKFCLDDGRLRDTFLAGATFLARAATAAAAAAAAAAAVATGACSRIVGTRHGLQEGIFCPELGQHVVKAIVGLSGRRASFLAPALLVILQQSDRGEGTMKSTLRAQLDGIIEKGC